MRVVDHVFQDELVSEPLRVTHEELFNNSDLRRKKFHCVLVCVIDKEYAAIEWHASVGTYSHCYVKIIVKNKCNVPEKQEIWVTYNPMCVICGLRKEVLLKSKYFEG